ncbi:MAG: type I-E CRISPR-associated protein Cse2/CasB [Chloroflexi bacterium]|nr:type I-E CRISPR-associated protein Cse2/CasB [Chloroflexota bacterium]
MRPPTEHERAFVGFLVELVENGDRAALAALRRGVGKRVGEMAELYPYVVPWVPQGARAWEEEAYYLVAALLAWHQGSWRGDDEHKRTNLGASLARLAEKVQRGSIERRFIALLNCHREDLPQHLRHAIGLLKSKEVPVDWARLLYDVKGWEWEGRPVQREWARAFWGSA